MKAILCLLLAIVALAKANPVDPSATFEAIMKVHSTGVHPFLENEDAKLTVVSC